jgi:hypothetical protein
MYDGWRGYLIAFFALVFVANAYLNLYGRLRVDITSEKKAIEVKDKEGRLAEREIEAREVEIQKLNVELAEKCADAPEAARAAAAARAGG